MHVTVSLGSHSIVALVDTGSAVTLMSQVTWRRVGGPELTEPRIRLTAFGGSEVNSIGSYSAKLKICNCHWLTKVVVVKENAMVVDLVIGRDILGQGRLSVSPDGIVLLEKESNARNQSDAPIEADLVENARNQSDAPMEVDLAVKKIAKKEKKLRNWVAKNAKLIATTEHDAVVHVVEAAVDLGHVIDNQVRDQVAKLIANYTPIKPAMSLIKMSLVLEDEVPVSQPPRRLAPAERDAVQTQIDEWMQEGIIRNSVSPYASPIVVVPKKDGTRRLCSSHWI